MPSMKSNGFVGMVMWIAPPKVNTKNAKGISSAITNSKCIITFENEKLGL